MYIFKNLLRKIFGTKNDRIISHLKKEVNKINGLETHISQLSDSELQSKTHYFKELLSAGKSLDDIMHEAFAVVREASQRVFGLRHFDVQIMAGISLYQGNIVEMKTGEGKTLASTLAAYLNALSGPVHIITANDYLASRDAHEMGKLYKFLGLTVGNIHNQMSPEEKSQVYKSDIVYGTSSEFGFDYLRDNMRYEQNSCQSELRCAIIDEADSILIDEARTPLIISGPTKHSKHLYAAVCNVVNTLSNIHFEIDEQQKNIFLTDEGIEHVESKLLALKMLSQDSDTGSTSIYHPSNISILHLVNQSLKAHFLFKKDVEYVVRDNNVYIVDQLTGRIMEGRRYSEGLHQAIEQKEGVRVREETKILASITIQNYFKLYSKLGGMTGTAMTEAAELKDIYNLDVIAIPTNHKILRIDHDDEIYGTLEEKRNAILEVVKEAHSRGQPILLGTTSIESSEQFSHLLKSHHISHNVLNAKNHEKEAYIISQAGKFGAVTIATNMAGRGTDIILGGLPTVHLDAAYKSEELANLSNDSLVDSKASASSDISTEITEEDKESDQFYPADNHASQVNIDPLENDLNNKEKTEKSKVIEAGGLLVIGTERHESRRIDNQLRGRSGRQGDPGVSKFYLSLEDNLMKVLANENTTNLLKRLGLKDGEAIHHPIITRGISKTQQRIEALNYEARKNLIKFDDIMNKQRKIIYEYRSNILCMDYSLYDTINDIVMSWLKKQIKSAIPADSFKEDWNLHKLHKHLNSIVGYDLPIETITSQDISVEELEYNLSLQVEMWILEKVFGIIIASPSDTNGELVRDVTNVMKDSNQISESVSHLRNLQQKIFHQDNILQAVKNTLLQCIDLCWQEHLNSLDGLRQNTSMRAYGQKDPFMEYNKEAFAIFEHMLDKIEEIFIASYSRLDLHHAILAMTNTNVLAQDHDDYLEDENNEYDSSDTTAPNHTQDITSGANLASSAKQDSNAHVSDGMDEASNIENTNKTLSPEPNTAEEQKDQGIINESSGANNSHSKYASSPYQAPGKGLSTEELLNHPLKHMWRKSISQMLQSNATPDTTHESSENDIGFKQKENNEASKQASYVQYNTHITRDTSTHINQDAVSSAPADNEYAADSQQNINEYKNSLDAYNNIHLTEQILDKFKNIVSSNNNQDQEAFIYERFEAYSPKKSDTCYCGSGQAYRQCHGKWSKISQIDLESSDIIITKSGTDITVASSPDISSEPDDRATDASTQKQSSKSKTKGIKRHKSFDIITSHTYQAQDEIVAESVANSTEPRRLDPCPCGSGKKYKHCCGQKK